MQTVVEKIPHDIVQQITKLEPKLGITISAKLSFEKQGEIRSEYVANLKLMQRLLKQAKDAGLEHATIGRLLKKYAVS